MDIIDSPPAGDPDPDLSEIAQLLVEDHEPDFATLKSVETPAQKAEEPVPDLMTFPAPESEAATTPPVEPSPSDAIQSLESTLPEDVLTLQTFPVDGPPLTNQSKRQEIRKAFIPFQAPAPSVIYTASHLAPSQATHKTYLKAQDITKTFKAYLSNNPKKARKTAQPTTTPTARLPTLTPPPLTLPTLPKVQHEALPPLPIDDLPNEPDFESDGKPPAIETVPADGAPSIPIDEALHEATQGAPPPGCDALLEDLFHESATTDTWFFPAVASAFQTTVRVPNKFFLPVSEVLPHIDLELGLEGVATIAGIPDSAASASCGPLDYHMNIATTFPHLVVRFVPVSHTNVSEFSVAGVGPGPACRCTHMIEYWTNKVYKGRRLTIRVALFPSLSVNFLIGLPYLRAMKMGIHFDGDYVSSPYAGKNYPITYIRPLLSTSVAAQAGQRAKALAAVNPRQAVALEDLVRQRQSTSEEDVGPMAPSSIASAIAKAKEDAAGSDAPSDPPVRLQE